MINIENVEVYGWQSAIRGARNPMNSWDKMDSMEDIVFHQEGNEAVFESEFKIGPNDYKLLKNLCIAGKDHRKWLRMIDVTMDITAPLYWWKEYDTYKVGTVANSCSTMHKIHAKEFEIKDFSYEKMLPYSIFHLRKTIDMLNRYREEYILTKNKQYWWQLIQVLPCSYNQKRTVHLNYEVLNAMHNARKNHKLDEWSIFCGEIEKFPYSEFITMDFE